MQYIFVTLAVLTIIQGVVLFKVKQNNKRWEHLMPGYTGDDLYCVPGDGEYNENEPKHKIVFIVLLSSLAVSAALYFI